MTTYPLATNDEIIIKPYLDEENYNNISECNNCLEESNSFYTEVNEEFFHVNY